MLRCRRTTTSCYAAPDDALAAAEAAGTAAEAAGTAAYAARDEASYAAAPALEAASDIGFTSSLETDVSGAVIYDQIMNFCQRF
jgi:hypothetical protein